MFQSVQLNINNPKFLLMQGKITKARSCTIDTHVYPELTMTQVLNMRPPEILGMVEEAAGTRMFEERKEKGLRTIAKKDQKVGELTSTIAEEIIPKLERLRAEKRAYVQWQRTCMVLERIRMTLCAWGRTEVQARVAAKEEEIIAVEHEVANMKRDKGRKVVELLLCQRGELEALRAIPSNIRVSSR